MGEGPHLYCRCIMCFSHDSVWLTASSPHSLSLSLTLTHPGAVSSVPRPLATKLIITLITPTDNESTLFHACTTPALGPTFRSFCFDFRIDRPLQCLSPPSNWRTRAGNDNNVDVSRQFPSCHPPPPQPTRCFSFSIQQQQQHFRSTGQRNDFR